MKGETRATIDRQTVKRMALLLTRAWEDHDMAKLGGWLELAGIDPTRVFCCKTVKHPLVGQSFRVGDVTVTVTHCMTHPRGQIMFDVKFDRLCPSMYWTGTELWFVTSIAEPSVRLRAEGLAALADLDVVPRPTEEAIRRYEQIG